MKTINSKQKKMAFPIVKVSLPYIPLFLCLFIGLSNTLSLKAQTLCDVTYTDNTIQRPAQPWDCKNFLNDFIVNGSNDNVIEVKLKFWIFGPTTNSNTGYWTKPGHVTTLADAQTLCTAANTLIDNMPIPQLSIWAGPTTTTQAKIHFVPSLVYVNDHDDYYNHISDSARSWKYFPYQDDNFINIYCGGAVGAPIHAGNGDWFFKDGTYHNVSTAPFNYIIFQPHLNYWGSNNDWINLSLLGWAGDMALASTLVHEVGHVLGLNHSTGQLSSTYYGAPYSSIQPTFGCCNNILSYDYVRETHVSAEGCGTPGGSNNLMSQNAQCNKYLSPQQVAVMHYNLRTLMIKVLSPNGYTAATNVNHAFDYSVTSNETWTSDRYFKGDITVKSGKILTINCGLAMTSGAKIIVEKGAVLAVNGGTITNISGRSWEGIYVWGDPVLAQTLNPSNLNFAQYQGWAKFTNATISHANIGVRNHKDPWGQHGGIITAHNTNFIDNYIDIQQIGPSSNPSGFASASRFYNCNFKTISEIGNNLSPYAHINLYRSVGAGFYACNFEYAAGNTYGNPGYGIYSVNSKFIVDKSGATPTVFKDLDRGVYVNNYNPLNVPSIKNSQFINNTGYGAYFMNTTSLVFEKNIVQNPGVYGAWSGVYLNNCKNFTIKNNTFTEDLNNSASVALSVFNSTSGSHQIFRNSFSKSFIAINAMGNNSGLNNTIDGLKMNCNDFTTSPNLYDIALDIGNNNTPPSVMRDQGAISSQNINNLVRNIYAAACVGNNQNKWYVHSSSSKIVNHGSNSQSNTKPLPQPACSRTIVNVVTSSYPLTYSIDCPGNTTSSGGGGTNQAQRLAIMNDYLSDLKITNPKNVNHFEIQATVASKLNLFLTDSLNEGLDSVINILENNVGNMDDADIQTVFAYINKGDFGTAQEKVNQLNENRADWASLLTKLIAMEQNEANGIYSLNTNANNKSFFENYANTEGKDGQSIAKALLLAACSSTYTEPHNYPETEGVGRIKSSASSNNEILLNETIKDKIEVYPNPTSTGVNILYGFEYEELASVEIKDLLGKVIYTNFINNQSSQFIPMNDLKNGMYLLTVKRNREVMYKIKVIKQD
jgi:hypothetical protein